MREMPVIIGHYTLKTGYEIEVQNLLRSLMMLGLEFDIEPIESRGSWRANSNYSIWLIERKLDEYSGRSILKLDADAVVRERPVLFEQNDFDCDFAARWQDFRYQRNELLGGTLYFANNDKAKEIVRRWKERCIVNPRRRNPVILDEVLKKMRGNVKITNLPAAYCKIFDTMRFVKRPVIEHFQASRRFKKEIDKR